MEVNGYQIGSGADLSGANLSGANLYGANLSGADLNGDERTRRWIRQMAEEKGIFVSPSTWPIPRNPWHDSDLTRTNLSGANLSGANLTGAN